jgi:hypothetical protein
MTRATPNLGRKSDGGRRAPAKKPVDREHDEAMIDEALDESFPASDPPAWGGATGAGAPEGAKTPKRKG